MSVRRDKKRGKWVVDVFVEFPDGSTQRFRKDSPVQTRRGAERHEREVRTALMEGTRKEKGEEKKRPVPKFRDFAGEFIEGYAVANNKPSEVESKRSILRVHLNPVFGALRLDKITARHIDRYKADKLKTGASPKSINNHLAVLSKLLRVAVRYGDLEHALPVEFLKLPPPKFDFLDFEEAARLIQASDPEWRPLITIAIHTGLRLGELRELKWDDVDLVAGRLVVRRSVWKNTVGTPKSGKSRIVPLSDTAISAFKKLRHLKGAHVFCGVGGVRLRKDQLKAPLRRACSQAGLRQVGWHMLRHTFASHLVMRNAPFKAVQELLGHADMTMTMRYAHLSPDARRDAVKLLDHASGNIVAMDSKMRRVSP